jgi:hypothetical protein
LEIITRDEPSQTLKDEIAAPDSEKSGPRHIQKELTVKIEEMQHTLVTLTQGFKEILSARKRARKSGATQSETFSDRMPAYAVPRGLPSVANSRRQYCGYCDTKG